MNRILLLLLLTLLVSPLLQGKEPKPPVFFHQKELSTAIEAAKAGGAVLMQYWNKGIDLQTEMKGSSPVTIADFKSNDRICKKLFEAYPDYGLLTEERIEDEKIQQAIGRWMEAEWTWMIDPLDGTRSFIAGKKEFGIHIALLHHGIPILGVNYYPATKTLYLAEAGCGAYKQVRNRPLSPIHTAEKSKAVLPVVSSRKSAFVHSFYTALLGAPITKKALRRDFRCVGSCGLRLCLIAEGKRNIYASSGESGSLWDYASGYVILQEAGGFISDLLGKPLDFRSEDYKFKNGTLSCGFKDLFERAAALRHCEKPVSNCSKLS